MFRDDAVCDLVQIDLARVRAIRAALTAPESVQALADTFSALGDEVRVGTVKFGSRAKRGGFEQGWEVKEIRVPSGAPSPHWVFIPALALIALIYFLQRRRVNFARLARGGA